MVKLPFRMNEKKNAVGYSKNVVKYTQNTVQNGLKAALEIIKLEKKKKKIGYQSEEEGPGSSALSYIRP